MPRRSPARPVVAHMCHDVITQRSTYLILRWFLEFDVCLKILILPSTVQIESYSYCGPQDRKRL